MSPIGLYPSSSVRSVSFPLKQEKHFQGDVKFTCIQANEIRRSACPLLHASPSRAYLRSLDLEADVV